MVLKINVFNEKCRRMDGYAKFAIVLVFLIAEITAPPRSSKERKIQKTVETFYIKEQEIIDTVASWYRVPPPRTYWATPLPQENPENEREILALTYVTMVSFSISLQLRSSIIYLTVTPDPQERENFMSILYSHFEIMVATFYDLQQKLKNSVLPYPFLYTRDKKFTWAKNHVLNLSLDFIMNITKLKNKENLDPQVSGLIKWDSIPEYSLIASPEKKYKTVFPFDQKVAEEIPEESRSCLETFKFVYNKMVEKIYTEISGNIYGILYNKILHDCTDDFNTMALLHDNSTLFVKYQQMWREMKQIGFLYSTEIKETVRNGFKIIRGHRNTDLAFDSFILVPREKLKQKIRGESVGTSMESEI